jgi:hypothetical protein
MAPPARENCLPSDYEKPPCRSNANGQHEPTRKGRPQRGARGSAAGFPEQIWPCPLPGEPLPFDPTKDTPTLLLPEALDRMTVQSMVEADVRGEPIHAYQKTE